MLKLGPFTTGKVHTILAEAGEVHLLLEYTDPRTNAVHPLPAGAIVALVSGGVETGISGAIDNQGRVSLVSKLLLPNVTISIDFKGREFIDLDAKVYVSDTDVESLDLRPLIGLPPA